MINKAIKLFLLGLLINPLLINIIGFISPFYGSLVLDDPEKSRYLLDSVNAFFPFVSLIFITALFYLQKIEERLWVKVLCIICSIIYLASSIYGFTPREESIGRFMRIAYHAMESSLLFLAALTLLKNSNKI